jgi:multidrug efflux system membrane fusion protein
VQRQVADYANLTGRTEAVRSVEIRARVSGYLARMLFKEGSMVRKGDLLFEIDPRPYQALLDQQEAHLALAQSQLRLAQSNLVRNQALARSTPGVVSPQQLDQDRTAVEEAAARIKVQQATREVARINLEFTKVTSPIDGQISRAFLTEGNIVRQDETLLTTVVSLDPMHVYFNLDLNTLLRIRKTINDGRIRMPGKGQLPVAMGLPGEDGFPRQGIVDFINNQFERNTDTIAVRAVFPNPEPPGGIHLLKPGLFVRIRLHLGPPYAALLVSDQAIASGRECAYVYVVDDYNKVVQRRVTRGPLQEDGLRVIEGLKPDERVVVAGAGRVRPGIVVEPETTAMPTRDRRSAEPARPAGKTK